MKPAYPAREFILRVLYFCLGTAVCALGCSAFVLSGIGTDPFSMLMQGVARTAHISNGTATSPSTSPCWSSISSSTANISARAPSPPSSSPGR